MAAMAAFWLELLTYAGIGLTAGFFAGLLGIGGGAIIGPLLILFFTGVLAFDEQHATHAAIATAAAVIVLTAPISAATHARQKNINWALAAPLSLAAMAGAFIGARAAAAHAPAIFLQGLLAAFLLANAAGILLPRRRAPRAAADARGISLPLRELLPVAAAIGGLSAVLGVGGGVLTVPYLHRRGAPMRQAIGTSAFVGLPLAAAAAAGYIIAGAGAEGMPAHSWGYVYLPALAGIAVFSAGAAYCGARLTNKLPAEHLRRLFALLLLCIALRLLWGAQ